MNRLVSLLIITLLTFSCKEKVEDVTPESNYEKGEEILGGVASTTDFGIKAFEHEVSGLSIEQKLDFFSGNAFFKQAWVPAPATTTARDGLGPFFNAKSCAACHPADGRGRPPVNVDDKQQGLLLRLSTGLDDFGRSMPDPNYGGQLQDLSIQRVESQGDLSVIYEEISGSYPDGMTYSLRKPTYDIINTSLGGLSAGTMVSPRVGQQLIGLGLLDAISEDAILANVDEQDIDGNSVSGKANYVWNEELQRLTIGKFGWKANQPSLRQQIAGAFNGDLGVTSSLFPDENCSPLVDCDTIPNGGENELSDDLLDQSELYIAALSVPIRRDATNEEIIKGKILFSKIGCVDCHIDKMTTGSYEVLPKLSNQEIRPYTDLLLHDMGEGLADNRPDFLADGQEWRTPPLWGVGLIQTVNGHQFLLHDGRARNIEEAILWHDGEGASSTNKFKELDKEDRQRIIQFIESF